MLKKLANGFDRRIAWGLLLTLGIVIYPWVASRYYLQIASVAVVFAVSIVGYDFVLGRAGQLSLSHAAFVGIGAYTSALLAVRLGMPFWISLPAAGIVAALFGFAVGVPSLRLRGHYLAIATLGFGEIVRLVLTHWTAVTNGVDGIARIPAPAFGPLVIGDNIGQYYLGVAILAVLVWVAWRINASKFGLVLVAIREGETAAEVMGIDTGRGKLMAFVLAAFYAGTAGSLYAYLFSYISPETFSLEQSIVMLAMLLLGGIGSIAGAVIGAVVLSFLPEWLRFLKDYYLIVYGIGILLMMSFMPNGIVGFVRERWGPIARRERRLGWRSSSKLAGSANRSVD